MQPGKLRRQPSNLRRQTLGLERRKLLRLTLPQVIIFLAARPLTDNLLKLRRQRALALRTQRPAHVPL